MVRRISSILAAMLWTVVLAPLISACGEEEATPTTSSSGGNLPVNVTWTGGMSGSGGADGTTSGSSAKETANNALGGGGQVGSNVVKNGDFALGGEYWDVTDSYAERNSTFGDGAFCITNPSSSNYMSFELGYPASPLDAYSGPSADAFAIAPGAKYRLSFRARGSNVAELDPALLHLSVRLQDLTSLQPTVFEENVRDSIGTDYTPVEYNFTPPAGATATSLVFAGEVYFDGSVCIDDVSLVRD